MRIASLAGVACLVFYLPVSSSAMAAQPISLWGRFDVRHKAAQDTSPNTRVTAELLAPSGKRHRVDGFWDGGDRWGVRFMPDETGKWLYSLASEPKVEGLDGASGGFDCQVLRTSDTRFLKHGALRVASSGTYLEHADGTPFFWLGDTVWTGPAFATLREWKGVYLNHRAENGFSVVQFNMVCPWRTAATDRDGNRAFEGDKNVRINPKFYQRLDGFMDAINDAGFAAAPILMWALGQKDPGNFLAEEDIEKIVRYEVARYGAHHVVWLLAGDNRYDPASAEKWKRIGRKIFGDAPRQPVSSHPTGMNWPWESWRNEKWLTVFGYQSGHGDDAGTLKWIHSGPVAKNWQNKPLRPIINLEPPYEDHLAYQSRQPHSAYNVRRAVYWSLLAAPPAGVTYGGHGLWSWQTESGKTPPDHPGTGVAKTWEQALQLPGSASMKRLARLMGSLEWWKFRPDPSILHEQPGASDPTKYVSSARSLAGDAALLYLPLGGSVRLSNEAGLSQFTGRWFDPRSALTQVAKPAQSGLWTAPTADEDWVLLLQEENGKR